MAALRDLQSAQNTAQLDLILYQRLRDWAQSRPAAACVAEVDSGLALSYGDFFEATILLRRRLGPAPRRLALRAPGGVFAAVAWVAALTGGHTLIPISPEAPAAEVGALLRRMPPDIILEDEHTPALPGQVFVAHFPGTSDRARLPQRLQARDLMRDISCGAQHRGPTRRTVTRSDYAEPAPTPGAVFLTTSGSTGEPKGVLLQARQIAWAAEQIRISHQLTSQDRGFTSLPFFHINAPVVSLCASLMAGSGVVVAPRFSRSHYWSWLEEHEITWASLVPTILGLLLDTEKPAFLPGQLRFVRTASAPLPATHMREFERRFGVPVIETYGLTEAASTVCATPLPPGQRKPGSVGLPAGVSLRIVEPAAHDGQPSALHSRPLRDVPRGSVGEICVRGSSVISGYAEGRGASAFQDGWFRTGDLGCQDADGYVFLTGRLRDIIIRGGENVSPREVEETLLAHPVITEAAVIGVPDPHYGEQVIAFVTTRQPWTPGLAADVAAFTAQRLTSYKRPAHVVALEAMPRTASGKLDRPRLRAMWTSPARDIETPTPDVTARSTSGSSSERRLRPRSLTKSQPARA